MEHGDDVTITDRELMVRLTRGEPRAAAEVYDRFGARAYSLARRILADDHLAQDVVQEVFVMVWRDADKFDGDRGTLSTWLLTMTHHRAVDAVRREESLRRRQERHESVELDSTSVDHVNDEVLATMRRNRVRGALGALPGPQCEALTLSYLGGYTQREIASLTGTPLGTVKTRMLLGMDRLRTLLAAEGPDSVDQESVDQESVDQESVDQEGERP